MSDVIFYCHVCNTEIPQARVDFLIETSIAPYDYACVKHSTEKRKQGLYMGEVGTSELKIVKKVYQDSVRSIFREAVQESDPEAETTDSEETINE